MARRKLTPEELALWRKIQDTVTPLPAALKNAPPGKSSPVTGKAAKRAPAAKSKVEKLDGLSAIPPIPPLKKLADRLVSGRLVGKPASTPSVHAQQAKPAIHTDALEPKLRRRLARGARDVDARIDLHGMRQEEARAALERFLHDARRRDARLVLVITGKGKGENGGVGVLRSALPRWLALPAFQDMVVGCEEAGRRHGGAGAYYVRLRRRRGPA